MKTQVRPEQVGRKMRNQRIWIAAAVISAGMSFALPLLIWLLAPGPAKLLAMLPLLPGPLLQPVVSGAPTATADSPLVAVATELGTGYE